MNLQENWGLKHIIRVSEVYRDAVAWAVGEGVLKGDDAGALNPRADLTRSQFAAMLMRYPQP